MKQGVISRIVSIVLGFFLCAYIGYQTWRALYNPVRTVSAVYTETDDSVSLSGVIVRDERALSSNYGSGVLEMAKYEGEKTGSGSSVAVIYENEAAAERSRKSAELSEQIEQITTLYGQSGEVYSLDATNARIAEYSCDIVDMLQGGVYRNLDTAVDTLKLQTMLREYIYRDKEELLNVINGLKKERDAISGGGIKKRIYAPCAGYFSHTTDGYEGALNSSFLETATPKALLEVMDKHPTPDKNAIGKVITSNTWRFAAVTDAKTASRFKKGSSVKLKFQNKAQPDVSATVERISEEEDGEVLIVLSCNTDIGSFTKLRSATVSAVLKTYSGLKVPREALRVDEEGNNGVYCLIESQVKFKPVEIIFEKGSFYVAYYDSSDTKSLLLYDEIIVSAKNLEHRKVLK